MEIILWLLSWIYINFPSCHLNKTVAVEIMIFATPSFYHQNPQVKNLAGRSCHMTSFFDENPRRASRKNWQGSPPTLFPFSIEIRESAPLSWICATIPPQIESHVVLAPYKAPHASEIAQPRHLPPLFTLYFIYIYIYSLLFTLYLLFIFTL